MNSSSKWFPKDNCKETSLLTQAWTLERQLRILMIQILYLSIGTMNQMELNDLLNQSKELVSLSIKLLEELHSISMVSQQSGKAIDRNAFRNLQVIKILLTKRTLRKRHSQLLYMISQTIRQLLTVNDSSDIQINAALKFISLFNENTERRTKQHSDAVAAQICDNTFPHILLLPIKINCGIIIQTISKKRSEKCCFTLISTLLTTCKQDVDIPNSETDETSSVEILRTLTSHLSSPLEKNCEQKILEYEKNTRISSNDQESPNSSLLKQLINEEESFIVQMIAKCLSLCPSSFGNISNNEQIEKIIANSRRNFWTQVGSTLEHVLLWWSHVPLAVRSPHCTKYLRNWLLSITFEEAPQPILTTLKRLGESLTVHVSASMWDRQFRFALVSGYLSVPIGGNSLSHNNEEKSTKSVATQLMNGTHTGHLWSDLLCLLATLSNNCDQYGTSPNEFPLFEQIPVLHRLDHSIHSMRLWALNKAKYLCSSWNMREFFNVVHFDIQKCLDQLQELRVPNLIVNDKIDVHVQVSVALRSKLISEIKVNIEKLKHTYSECIDILGCVCRMTSLATLSLCFPISKQWQNESLNEHCNDYVPFYLNEIYLPVIEASNNIDILGLILNIMCEAWLDHIYLKKIKFSRCGAVNLLKDFSGVAEWIRKNNAVPSEHVNKLVNHEVLKMCEGVGKILLRKPEEVIPMLSDNVPVRANNDIGNDKAMLPPEMFVPNQKRWLQLRAKNRTKLSNCCCLCTPSTIVL